MIPVEARAVVFDCSLYYESLVSIIVIVLVNIYRARIPSLSCYLTAAAFLNISLVLFVFFEGKKKGERGGRKDKGELRGLHFTLIQSLFLSLSILMFTGQ